MIYPNPMANFTLIKSDLEINSISLFSLTGKEVISITNIKSNTYKLLREDLKPGVYFIRINKEFYKKLILE